MHHGFWNNIEKPILALAPMADVTDAAFREIIARYGKPDVLWTEFVSADGLMSEGRERLMLDLKYSEEERPIVAQIFGSNPDNFYRTALLLNELGFDGIDINMGCPDRSVEKQHAGAALIEDLDLAAEIIREAKRGAGNLPVSVKTRIGYRKNEIETLTPRLLEAGPAALTFHLRTRKEMSKVPAHWELAGGIVKIRDKAKSETLILGNGDVESLEEARSRAEETGMDGIMVGRGIFGNPWLFNPSINRDDLPLEERFRVMLEHVRLFEKFFRKPGEETKNFDVMKKHFKAYVSGFDGAKELRMRLMDAANGDEIRKILKEEFPKMSTSG